MLVWPGSFFPNFRLWIPKRCEGVHCVDLGESFPTNIYLQNLASIQPRTSPTETIPDTPIPTPPPLKPALGDVLQMAPGARCRCFPPAGQWIRNTGIVIVSCEAPATNFGGLVLGCIEAESYELFSFCSIFKLCNICTLLHVWNHVSLKH